MGYIDTQEYGRDMLAKKYFAKIMVWDEDKEMSVQFWETIHIVVNWALHDVLTNNQDTMVNAENDDNVKQWELESFLDVPRERV